MFSPLTYEYMNAYNSLKVTLIVVVIFSILGCKKDPPGDSQIPVVITLPAVKITTNTAESGGNCTDGGAPVLNKGVCWSTSPNPTTDSQQTNDSSGAGTFTSIIKGLYQNTTYYLRAFAINTYGVGYGNEIIFSTQQTGIIVNTGNLINITGTTAICEGSVVATGSVHITGSGICWGTSHNPTLENNFSYNDSGTDSFECFLSGLTPNSFYYVRAFANYPMGTEYGNECSFTTTSSPDTRDKFLGIWYATDTTSRFTYKVEIVMNTKSHDWHVYIFNFACAGDINSASAFVSGHTIILDPDQEIGDGWIVNGSGVFSDPTINWSYTLHDGVILHYLDSIYRRSL